VKVTISNVFSSFQTLKMFLPASPNQMNADPQNSCADILSTVLSSGLTWGLTETLFLLFLMVRKRYLKNAKKDTLTHVFASTISVWLREQKT
jgi:hypothetical protein